MKITKDTRLQEIMNRYPWLIDEAVKIDERFRILNNPIGRMFIRNATISGLSEKAGLSSDELISHIQKMIDDHEA